MKKKIAFIVQRYGQEINGGAEWHCREFAERLTPYFDITVLTTCALDYVTWKNHYPVGKETINQVNIVRFSVPIPRHHTLFSKLYDRLSYYHFNFYKKNGAILYLEKLWMYLQGPYCPSLLKYLEQNKNNYDLFVLFSYHYWTTYKSLFHVHTKAILVPTAHDDASFQWRIFDRLFSMPKYILFNTEEEKKLIEKRSLIPISPSTILSPGVSFPLELGKAYDGLKNPYLLYVGRIEEGKGCQFLFKNFLHFIKKYPEKNLDLVLIGKASMMIPNHPKIKHLGFVSDEIKWRAIQYTQCLIVPSRFESLSLVALEAWSQKIPVLANESSEVLKAHCEKSLGGLTYQENNEEDFSQKLFSILSNKEMSKKLGEQGFLYVKENYTWDKTISKLVSLINTVIDTNGN